MSVLSKLRGLLRNRSGVAMVEFALGAPFLLAAGLWGTEVANYALVTMKVNQLAVHLADNASRIGDTSTLQNRRIYESDINDILIGANIHAGAGVDIYEHGRVIISSVEVWNNSVHGSGKSDGQQFIHWQRCLGSKNATSDYGNQNQALPDGIGPDGDEITAEPEAPVMFVEISYTYQPLISERFVGDRTIKTISAFMVRDSRDMSGLLQRNVSDPDPVASCTAYTNGAELYD